VRWKITITGWKTTESHWKITIKGWKTTKSHWKITIKGWKTTVSHWKITLWHWKITINRKYSIIASKKKHTQRKTNLIVWKTNLIGWKTNRSVKRKFSYISTYGKNEHLQIDALTGHDHFGILWDTKLKSYRYWTVGDQRKEKTPITHPTRKEDVPRA